MKYSLIKKEDGSFPRFYLEHAYQVVHPFNKLIEGL